MQIKISMRESGKMIKLMDMVYIIMLMVLDMKETGLMINNMVSVLKDGLMGLSIEATM
jgi:hypothetical protein